MKTWGRWIAAAGMVFAACVEQPPKKKDNSLSPAQIENIRKKVASSTEHKPGPEENYYPVNAKFGTGEKITLLGYSVTPKQVRPGTKVTITWYWRCNTKLDAGWHLFTHLDDAANARKNLDDVGEARSAYQPDRWRPDEYITDQQTFDIPPPQEWNSPKVKLSLGFWRGETRMEIVNPGAGKVLPDGRFLAAEFDTGMDFEVSSLAVPKAAAAPVIDGKLDDAAWLAAGNTGPLVDPITGAPSPSNAHGNVKVTWDDAFLYLAWDVNDDYLVEAGNTRDAHNWEKDTTEVLIDPNGDGKDYYEIQLSPGNHLFDSQQPAPPAGGNFGKTDWNPAIQSAVVLKGASTIGKDDDVDVGYTAEMAIPWSEINAGAKNTPPQAGDAWRVNFFLMDAPKMGGQRAAAWSAPRTANFHAFERFGRLTFIGGAPGAAPLAPPAIELGDAAPSAVNTEAGTAPAVDPDASAAPPAPAAEGDAAPAAPAAETDAGAAPPSARDAGPARPGTPRAVPARRPNIPRVVG